MKKNLNLLFTILMVLFFLLTAFCLLRFAAGSLAMFPTPEQQQKTRFFSGIGLALTLLGGIACAYFARKFRPEPEEEKENEEADLPGDDAEKVLPGSANTPELPEKGENNLFPESDAAAKEAVEIIIDGNSFSDLEGFYDEIDRLLTKDLGWKTGHNFMAFNDLLRGGFGVHEYGQPLKIKWLNYSKSKKELGDSTILTLLEIILDCDEIGHQCSLELYGWDS